MLNLVDFYGASFIVFILTIGEIVAVCWVYGMYSKNQFLFYVLETFLLLETLNCLMFVHHINNCDLVLFLGVNRLCRDIEFMINVKPGIYWRVCWAFLTPLLMFTILIYTFISYEPLKYKDQPYPDWATCKFLTVLF